MSVGPYFDSDTPSVRELSFVLCCVGLGRKSRSVRCIELVLRLRNLLAGSSYLLVRGVAERPLGAIERIGDNQVDSSARLLVELLRVFQTSEFLLYEL